MSGDRQYGRLGPGPREALDGELQKQYACISNNK